MMSSAKELGIKEHINRAITSEHGKIIFNYLKERYLNNLARGKDIDYRFYVALAILQGSGLRPSELLSLTFGNLEYITSSNNTEYLVINNIVGKGKKIRGVVLGDKLSVIIKNYCEYCNKTYFSNIKRNDKYLIFKVTNNKYAGNYTYKWLQGNFKKLLTNINMLHNYTLHSFRHSYAIYLSKINPDMARLLLGHERFSTTGLYLEHLESSIIKDSISKVDNNLPF